MKNYRINWHFLAFLFFLLPNVSIAQKKVKIMGSLITALKKNQHQEALSIWNTKIDGNRDKYKKKYEHTFLDLKFMILHYSNFIVSNKSNKVINYLQCDIDFKEMSNKHKLLIDSTSTNPIKSKFESKKDYKLFCMLQNSSLLKTIPLKIDTIQAKEILTFKGKEYNKLKMTEVYLCGVSSLPRGFKSQLEDSIYYWLIKDTSANIYPHEKIKCIEKFINENCSKTNHNYTKALKLHYDLYTFDGEEYSYNEYKVYSNKSKVNYWNEILKNDSLLNVIREDSINRYLFNNFAYEKKINRNNIEDYKDLIKKLYPKETSYMLFQKVLNFLNEENQLTTDDLKNLNLNFNDNRYFGYINDKFKNTPKLFNENVNHMITPWFENKNFLKPGELIRPLYKGSQKLCTFKSDSIKPIIDIASLDNVSTIIDKETELLFIDQSDADWYYFLNRDKVFKIMDFDFDNASATNVTMNFTLSQGVKDFVKVKFKDKAITFGTFNVKNDKFSSPMPSNYRRNFNCKKNFDNQNFDICYSISGNNYKSIGNINTPFGERVCSIKNDTLFFASNGHAAFGGYDIYFTIFTLREDGELYFSPPINMGKKINTSFNELSYVSNDTSNGFVSDRNGMLDIYQSTPKKEGETICVFSGYLMDKQKESINGVAELISIDNETDNVQNLGQVNTHDDGYFEIKTDAFRDDKKTFLLNMTSIDGNSMRIKLYDGCKVKSRKEDKLNKQNNQTAERIEVTNIDKDETPIAETDKCKVTFRTNESNISFDANECIITLIKVICKNNNNKNTIANNFNPTKKDAFIYAYADERGPEDKNLKLTKLRYEATKKEANILLKSECPNCVIVFTGGDGLGETTQFNEKGKSKEENWSNNRTSKLHLKAITK